MPRSPSGRFPVLAAALLLAACARPGPAAPPAALDWQGCGDGVQCATLTVPVDHARPDGPTVELAVARRPARDGEARLGSVVLNPGGPGGSGVDLVRSGAVGAGVLDRFDVVSWDPRGVGRSRALDCDGPVGPYRALDWTPDDDAERAALDDAARRLAEACRASAGDLAAHLGTAAAAEDLDRLRAALGEDRLNFVGFSYGTAVGLHFLARHPDRIRALVLDGVADPREDEQASLTGQARALEAQLPVLLGAGVAAFERVLAAAEAGAGPVSPTVVTMAAVAASYPGDGGPKLAAALAAAEAGNGAGLQALAEGYWDDAAYGPYLAVVCSDQAHPAGPGYDGLVGALAAAAPRFGAVMANELRPCAWWPSTTPVPDLAVATSAPVLVLGNTGDVATPHATAEAVAGDLDRGVLVTLDGRGHTSFGRSRCVDGIVRRYLDDGSVPPEGTRCR